MYVYFLLLRVLQAADIRHNISHWGLNFQKFVVSREGVTEQPDYSHRSRGIYPASDKTLAWLTTQLTYASGRTIDT